MIVAAGVGALVCGILGIVAYMIVSSPKFADRIDLYKPPTIGKGAILATFGGMFGVFLGGGVGFLVDFGLRSRVKKGSSSRPFIRLLR
jgi:hypothetical protein